MPQLQPATPPTTPRTTFVARKTKGRKNVAKKTKSDAESQSQASRSRSSATLKRRKSSRATQRRSLTVGGRSFARPLGKVLKNSQNTLAALTTTQISVALPEVQLNPCLSHLQAIVVNLERREDRMQGCTARLRLHCPWLQHSRFIACDGKKETISESDVTLSWETNFNVIYQKKRAIRKGWDDLDTYQERRLGMSPGERGCAVSHIRAWQQCVDLGSKSGYERPLLVLEDDAAPTPEFSECLSRALTALPSDAGVLYLGYSQAADWKRRVSPDLVEAEYVWTTVAYIIWPSAARFLLSRLPIDAPVDNWMAALCARDQVKSYCVTPKIVHQADAWNVNSDVGHSDEHYWGPCSDIKHSDEFYWGCEAEHAGDFLISSSTSSGAASAPTQAVVERSLFWDLESEDSSDESME